jgi:hypothetical protein
MARLFRILILFVGSGIGAGFAGAVLAGCGGDAAGGADGGGVTAQQAQADCEHFISAVYCPSFMKCLSGFTMDDCLATLPGIDCAAVTGENGQLATCEAQLKGATCQQLVGDGTMPAVPLSCKGVFHF